MPETTYRKKLIEVALPLEAINAASQRENYIYKGNPSGVHKWWAQRPFAAARAVLFAQLVDDPSAWPDRYPTAEAQEAERKRLFRIIEQMIRWEASLDRQVIGEARREIARSWAHSHPSEHSHRILMAEATDEEITAYLANELPTVHDPFAGAGTIPLEAQRLGLRAIASDLNPVAVLLNRALLQMPPRFAGRPPINPGGPDSASKKGKRSKQTSFEGKGWKGANGLADDVRYYGRWVGTEARERIGHLYPDFEVTANIAKERPDLQTVAGERLPVIAALREV